MMTPWITAAWGAFIAATIGLCALQLFYGVRITTQRYRLAWTEPEALAQFPQRHFLVHFAITALAFIGLLLSALLLVPASPLWRPEPLAGPALAAGALAASGVVFRGLQRSWSAAHAMLASALLTAAICGLTRVGLGSMAGARAHWHMLVVALTLVTALWAWLAGVWLQQLDSGRPWTVAGRLLPWTRVFGALNAFAAVLALFAISMQGTGPTGGWLYISLALHVFLLLALTLCLRRWWGVGFLFLLIAVFASVLVLVSSHRGG